MKHLGERVSALVDGQLDHDARDAALAHLAGCPQCKAAVEAERRTSFALRELPDVRPSRDLLERLSELAPPEGPPPPPRRPFPVVDPAAGHADAPTHPGSGPVRGTAWPTARRRAVVRGTVAGTMSIGVIAAALASLGGPEQDEPVVPPMREFTVEHARSTDSLPFSDPATGLLREVSAGGGAP